MVGNGTGWVRAVGVAAVATLLSGCSGEVLGGEQPCTAIGCSSGVNFHVEAGLEQGVNYTFEACFDDICRSAVHGSDTLNHISAPDFEIDLANDRVMLLLPDTYTDWSGEHDVQLRVLDDTGSEVVSVSRTVEMTPTYLNGPDCPPPCWTAEVR